MKYDITGIILSGGKSTRMGRNKAFITVESVPIIQRIHSVFTNLFNEIIVVTNEKNLLFDLDATIHIDLVSGLGALGGLYTGLFYSSFPYSFCVACDMPFLKRKVIAYLIQQAENFDVVVPRTQDGLQPLHALYSKNCLEPIKTTLDEGRSKIIDFYPRVRVRVIEEKEFLCFDPERNSFLNVNTPEELRSIVNGKRSCRAR
jgi:molybdopterin-guanine dinucleotide biosynthesis protein A